MAKSRRCFGNWRTWRRRSTRRAESRKQDVLKPVVELSKLYDEALMFTQQADLASAQLNSLMGRPAEAPIGALQDAPTASELPALSTLVQLAIDHQPELQGARLSIERAKAELAVGQGRFEAGLHAQGGYMVTPRGTDAWTAQVGITWPSAPWARGKIDARIAEATADVACRPGRLDGRRARAAAHRFNRRTSGSRPPGSGPRCCRTTIVPQSRQALEVLACRV